jgi:hypothetical protein
MSAFTPNDQGSTTLAVGVASATVEVTTVRAKQMELNAPDTNTDIVYVRVALAAGSAATVAASYPVQPGHCKLISLPEQATVFISTISGTAAQSLIVSPGNGDS